MSQTLTVQAEQRLNKYCDALAKAYGIDISKSAELIAAKMTVDEICAYIGADSLAFLSQEGLIDSIGLKFDMPYSGLCMDSFNGDYPTGLYDYEADYVNNMTAIQKENLKGGQA